MAGEAVLGGGGVTGYWGVVVTDGLGGFVEDVCVADGLGRVVGDVCLEDFWEEMVVVVLVPGEHDFPV